MTPPKISSLVPQHEVLACYPEETPVIDYSEHVCRADSYVSAPPVAESPIPNFRDLFRQQQISRSLASYSFSAFGPSRAVQSPVPDYQAAVRGTPAVFASIAACVNDGPLDNAPDAGPTEPPTENPPVNPGGSDGGIGGINTSFASSACAHPRDLDPASDAVQLIMTCSDGDTGGTMASRGLIERISATTGDKTSLQLPTSFNSQPVHLMTSSDSNGTFYTGFAASGSRAEFEGGTRLFNNSGIFTVAESNPAGAQTTSFPTIQQRLSGEISSIAMAGINGQVHATVDRFQPNTPVSMARVGDYLYVLTANMVLNPNVPGYNMEHGTTHSPIDYLPTSVGRFRIGPSGALTPEPVTVTDTIVAGTTTTSNFLIWNEFFRPTAIAAVGTERIATLIQGVPGTANPISNLFIQNLDFTPGLDEPLLGDSDVNIPISVSDPTGQPAFRANSSSQLPIVTVDDRQYALVGSGDGDESGRVAIVDITREEPESGFRVQFARLFEDGSEIASIQVATSGNFAYVTSSSGRMRAMDLRPGANFQVGQEFLVAPTVQMDNIIPGALRADHIVLARPNVYTQVAVDPTAQ